MTDQELMDAALAVRDNAYCPYSGYKVGAALVDDRGQMHIGCNVENAAYPQGNCAEASAIGAMISAGGKTIVTIAVAGGRDAVTACTPCGGAGSASTNSPTRTRALLSLMMTTVGTPTRWKNYCPPASTCRRACSGFSRFYNSTSTSARVGNEGCAPRRVVAAAPAAQAKLNA